MVISLECLRNSLSEYDKSFRLINIGFVYVIVIVMEEPASIFYLFYKETSNESKQTQSFRVNNIGDKIWQIHHILPYAF